MKKVDRPKTFLALIRDSGKWMSVNWIDDPEERARYLAQAKKYGCKLYRIPTSELDRHDGLKRDTIFDLACAAEITETKGS